MNTKKSRILLAMATAAVCIAAITLVPANRKLRPTEAVDPPDEVRVTGVVRDFLESHPDFQSTPSDGPGEYTGLVAQTLGPFGRPTYSGPGYRVLVPAADGSGRFIAPHIAGWSCQGEPTGVPPVLALRRVWGENTGDFDGYEAWRGAYAGPNRGKTTTIATNATTPGMIRLENSSTIHGDVKIGPGGNPNVVVDVRDDTSSITGTVSVMTEAYTMPPVTVPTMSGTPQELSIGDDGQHTLAGDALLSDLELGQDARLVIQGEIDVLVLGDVSMDQSSRIEIPEGSVLRLYCHGRFQLNQQAFANPDTSAPERLQVFMLGQESAGEIIELRNSARMTGRVVAIQSKLNLEQQTHFFGTFVGGTIRVGNNSSFHADNSGYTGGPGSYPDDVPATLSTNSGDGGITDASSFDQWFRDLPGLNMSGTRSITLVRQYDGSYLYDDQLDPRYSGLGGFWPIDDSLLGNESGPHNPHFTYYFSVSFVYDLGAAQYLEVTADADVWVYIDGFLAIDLGGLRTTIMDQRIDLDRLCLEQGREYALTFFLAERERTGSRLRIHTNIQFTGSLLPVVSDMYD